MFEAVDYVVCTPEGGLRVKGTRVSLDSVVHAYAAGEAPETIVRNFPSLTLEQVHGALAFYLRNRAEVDQYLREQAALWEKVRQASAASPAVAKARAARQSQAQDAPG
jgi:uncharacterized protein (DUF433 family)